jgi:hypothetical protein
LYKILLYQQFFEKFRLACRSLLGQSAPPVPLPAALPWSNRSTDVVIPLQNKPLSCPASCLCGQTRLDRDNVENSLNSKSQPQRQET